MPKILNSSSFLVRPSGISTLPIFTKSVSTRSMRSMLIQYDLCTRTKRGRDIRSMSPSNESRTTHFLLPDMISR